MMKIVTALRGKLQGKTHGHLREANAEVFRVAKGSGISSLRRSMCYASEMELSGQPSGIQAKHKDLTKDTSWQLNILFSQQSSVCTPYC